MAEVLSSPANEPPGLAEEEVLRALVAGPVEHVQVEGRGEADFGHDGEAGEQPLLQHRAGHQGLDLPVEEVADLEEEEEDAEEAEGEAVALGEEPEELAAPHAV